jgi:hypothetical protein
VDVAADLCGVFAEGEPVEAGSVRVAEQQVELPAAIVIEPVAGELLAADLVSDEPGAV